MSVDDNGKIVRAYSLVAFLYGLWTWLTERNALLAALRTAAVEDGQAILEVAVGTGELFQHLVRANPKGRTVGLDLTPAMLRRARQKAVAVGAPHELVEGDARSLPFADASFDLVFNNNMLGLVPPGAVAPILGELRRVLRPDGRLVVVMMRRPVAWLARALYQVGAVWLGRWRDLEMAPLFEVAGLKIARREVVTRFGVPSDVFELRPSAG
jgi:ubiquinone/menaquinone biosynthesis C-methylase UbiE